MSEREWHQKCPRCESTGIEAAAAGERDAGRDGKFFPTHRCLRCHAEFRPSPPAESALRSHACA